MRIRKFIMNCFIEIGLFFIALGASVTGINKTAFVKGADGKDAAYGYTNGIDFLPVFFLKISSSSRDTLRAIFWGDE